jgi:hypothetical protein
MNWDEMQATFQDGGEPIAPDEVRRFRRRQQAKVAVEVIAGAALVAVYANLLSRSPPPALVAVAIASLLFVGMYLTYLFTIRSGLLRASAVTTGEWLALLRQQVDADLRWNRFLTRVCIGAALFGTAWAPWLFFTFADAHLAAPWRAVVGFGSYFVLVFGMLGWCGRTRRRLLARREALERPPPAGG